MDKKTFINELKTALSVLQEDELNDIINEYEQHIDMKMKNGLSEDEAIADFGSLSELTADILEAYHVRADYAGGRKKAFLPNDKAAGKELLQQTGKTCKAAGEKAAHGLRGLGAWLLGILVFWKQAALGTWKKLSGRWQERKRKRLEAADVGDSDASVKKPLSLTSAPSRLMPPGRASREKKPAGRQLGRSLSSLLHWGISFIGNCFRLFLRTALWCIRTAWNVCWIGFSLFCAGFGLLSLFLFGLLTVLWLQHYPLAGVTVGCLGLVCCFFSAAGLGLTLVRRKKKPETKTSLPELETEAEPNA